jgi:hypothetical protein
LPIRSVSEALSGRRSEAGGLKLVTVWKPDVEDDKIVSFEFSVTSGQSCVLLREK